MPNVLIYADTFRSPEMRHEVPMGIPDPFLYAESNGDRRVLISSMEMSRMKHLPLQIQPGEDFGQDELIKQGFPWERMGLELALRAVKAWGIESAAVPTTFPLELADYLRAGGVDVRSDRELFRERRRVKTAEELAGIRRAQKAAEAGMTAARELLRRAEAGDGRVLRVDGEPLTCERVKVAIENEFLERDCTSDEMVVSHGEQAAIGHHMGEGEILAGESIVIDIWPKDRASGCHADMTRTYVVGEPPAEIVEWHRLAVEALHESIAMLKAGVDGKDVNDRVCELFEAAGQPTRRTKEAGKPLEEGFYHGLGHGVGLEVHEAPSLTIVSTGPLVAGDVVTVEPGLYRPGFGGVRVEDLVLVTEDGAENLTDFPYDLIP